MSEYDNSYNEETENEAQNNERTEEPKTYVVDASDKLKEVLAKTYVYVGPNIKGTFLRQSTVYMDGVPEEYAKHEVYKHLFVPVEKLSEASEELKRKGSMLNTFYEQAKAVQK